jgi:uncharacterized protein YndB with AHSA1/START domain
MATMDGVKRGTGRTRAQWFAALDAWGAPGRAYREISDWLMGEHDLSRWWAQKLIVEYEQERGLRSPGIRRDGTFEVGASKTVGAPVDRLFKAFVDPRQRKRWFPNHRMKLSVSDPSRSARFDWEDGSSQVRAVFEDKGSSRSTVTVMHNRLKDARGAEKTKTMWRERLADLKTLLES